MKKIMVFAVFIGIVITGGIAAYKTDVIPKLFTDIVNRFQEETNHSVITVSGNVEITEVNLGFILSGRIQEMLAQEGQSVKKDDKLAMLENAELEGVVAQNKAILNEAIVKLEDLKTGARVQEIEEVKANVKAIQAELSKAKKDLDRIEALYNQDLTSASQLDAARSAYNAVLARHQQALERLSLVKEGPTKEAIKAAEYRVEQAKAALRISEERLKNTLLYAPMSGVILRKNAEVGEIIAAGTPVYTIGDLENPWIKVYIKEDKLGLVKLRQQAQIKIDSYPDKVYTGIVTYISSQAEFTPKTIQTQEERVKLVFGVKVSVKNESGELKPGMPADVKIFF